MGRRLLLSCLDDHRPGKVQWAHRELPLARPHHPRRTTSSRHRRCRCHRGWLGRNNGLSLGRGAAKGAVVLRVAVKVGLGVGRGGRRDEVSAQGVLDDLVRVVVLLLLLEEVLLLLLLLLEEVVLLLLYLSGPHDVRLVRLADVVAERVEDDLDVLRGALETRLELETTGPVQLNGREDGEPVGLWREGNGGCGSSSSRGSKERRDDTDVRAASRGQ